MQNVGPYEAALLIAAAAAMGCLVGHLPRTFRERRWALRYGDEYERRIGHGMLLWHLAAIAGALSFVVRAARLATIPGDAVRNPEALRTSLTLSVICCVLVVAAMLHQTRRSRRGRDAHVVRLPVREDEEAAQ